MSDRGSETVRVAFVTGIHHQDHRWLHVACNQWPAGTTDVLFKRLRQRWDSSAHTSMQPSLVRSIIELLQADPEVVQLLVRPFRIGVRLRHGRPADWTNLAKRLEGAHFWHERAGGYYRSANHFEIPEISLETSGHNLSDGHRCYKFDLKMATMLIEFDRSIDPWGLIPAHWAARVDLEAIRLVERLFDCQTLMHFSLAPGRIGVVRNCAYPWDEVDREVNHVIARIRPPIVSPA